MLQKLSVRNFAVISRVEFTPRPGLNVFTGETGAGKSVAISALGFALGARGSVSLIKDGADKLEVRAEFDTAGLSEELKQKYLLQKNSVVLSRSLDRNGKGKSFINARPVSVAELAELGKCLVDFHGQHEHQSLLRGEVQQNLLDTYAGLLPLRQKTHDAYRQWRDLLAQWEAAQLSEQEKQRQLDLCAFQLQEIEAAAPKEGEDAELEQKLPQLKHAGRLLELCAEAYQALYEAEDSASAQLGRAAKQVREMAQLDEHVQAAAEALAQAETFLSDACDQLSTYQGSLDADPNTLDEMLSRHEKLKRLKLKYGPELRDVFQTARHLKAQMDRLQNAQLVEEELQKQAQKARQELDALCEQLHQKRLAAAARLSRCLEKEIRPLGFDGLQFEIAVEMDSENPGPHGADRVEFLFSPNPGQVPRPLRAVASGGELSRVMLGLKTVLAGEVPVMVFDEVDSGVGGRTAALVGQKLHAVAQGRQVLCVTHLASVAACADAHFHIEKTTDGKTTEVRLQRLSAQETEKEIARMLGALSDQDQTALLHARQMLSAAHPAD
ncbi:DNA repair protein RecN [Candidatus Avelusimicrobium facis]|uniref:DNA repair protein RecN n=1 Tax=Candidatus Avelusimicrobium facis TaxID=3416203 RepID=UPI003D11E76F